MSPLCLGLEVIVLGARLCLGEPQAAAQTTTIVCPPLIEWSTELQKRAAAEIRALPPGAALPQLVARAIEQRDVVRACRPTAPAGR